MSHKDMQVERYFWRFWLGGLAILAIMIAINPLLVSDVAPWGIRDHQSAGSAARVDAIQRAWQDAGVMKLAQAAIALDLFYIAIYSFGAFCGGKIFFGAGNATLKWLGAIIMLAAMIVGVADLTETTCQLIQALRIEGNDRLAAIAAAAQPIKSTAFLTSFFGIISALAIRKRFASAA